jgi:NADPH-dependent ferric siderophore reductase
MTQNRRAPRLRAATVIRTERLTPHLIRVVLGGEGLAGFGAGTFTDEYVKLQFPQAGVAYPEPLDTEIIRRDLPRDQWPHSRTYTVRSWDPESRELAIDFVHHGDKGIAGPWAARAKPGDVLHFFGPGGAYTPDPSADWYLYAGDESALPAIAASVAKIPAGALAHVFVEVEGAADELKFDGAGDLRVSWVHRGAGPVGSLLVDAVRALDFPAGKVDVFVHGEAGFVKDLRRYLRVERALPREQLSISGYWRRGMNEDGWQSGKGEWNAAVEAEEAAALA